MADHDDDKGMMDKVKDALGMGEEDERRETGTRERTETGTAGTYEDSSRTGTAVRDERTETDELAGTGNRPGGPDYGGAEPAERGSSTETGGFRDPERRNEGL